MCDERTRDDKRCLSRGEDEWRSARDESSGRSARRALTRLAVCEVRDDSRAGEGKPREATSGSAPVDQKWDHTITIANRMPTRNAREREITKRDKESG